MYFHVMVGATDLEASKSFYDATLAALGIPSKGKFREQPSAYMYGDPATGLFFITDTIDGNPATHANGGTIMFKATTKDQVDAWYAAGIANGGTSEDAPAPAPIPGATAARLRDPTGNKIGVIAFA